MTPKQAIEQWIERAKEAEAKATKGPWRHVTIANLIIQGDWERVIGQMGTSPDTDSEAPFNRGLTCLARNSLLPVVEAFVAAVKLCDGCYGTGILDGVLSINGQRYYSGAVCPICEPIWRKLAEELGYG